LYFSKLYAVNKHDSPLFKPAFEALMDTLTRLEIPMPFHAIVNLDPGFDSNANKTVCLQNGCTPNIKTNPRNSKTESMAPQPDVYKQRYVNERAFAWEDCYRRLVIRYEVLARNHYAFCLMAAALTLLRLIRAS
jgi:Transposase DDE domain